MTRGREALRWRGPSGTTVSPRGRKTDSVACDKAGGYFQPQIAEPGLQEPSVLAALPSVLLNCLSGAGARGRVSACGD